MERCIRSQKMERNGKVKQYILDTSVVIKWFSEFDEDDLDKALNLRHEILTGKCSITVPDLLFYELSNALRYNIRFLSQDIKDALKSVIDMGFVVAGVEVHVMELAIDIAFKNNVTIYDSCFLALSQTEKMPLITSDYKFVDRMKGFENIIRLHEL